MRDRQASEPSRGWVGVFDVATGKLERLLYDTGPQSSDFYFEGLAYSPDDGFGGFGHLEFDPTEHILVEERYTTPWSFWSSLAVWSDTYEPHGPKHSHPDSTVTFYNVADGSVITKVDLAHRQAEWSWSSDGTRLAAIDLDLTIAVFEP